MKYFLLVAVIWAGCQHLLSAQSHFLMQSQQRQEIKLSYGLRPNMAFQAAYARQWPGKLPLALSVGLETGLIQPLSENYALHFGGQLALFKKRGWLVANELLVETGHLESKIYKAKAWEIQELVTAGWYGRRSGVAIIAGFTQNLGTHLAHSDFYRNTGYADAKDGWYGGLGGYWQAGLRLNQNLWQHLNVSLQMSYAQSTKGYSIGPLPALVQLGAGWRW